MLGRRWMMLAAMGAGLVLAMPGDASAQVTYRLQSATFCTPITSTYASVRSDSGALGNGGSSAMRMVCPILDDLFLPKSIINGLNVDVFDGSTSAPVDVRACVSFSTAVGGTCGVAASTSTSGTGLVRLNVNPSVWATYEFDYGYLVINLPPLSKRASSVHGWQLLNFPE